MGKKYSVYPPSDTRRGKLLYFLERSVVFVFLFAVIIVGTYMFFSMFDTPAEHQIRVDHSQLSYQYRKLSARYDSIALVLNNVIDRDRNVFRILFESEPYEFDETASDARWETYERLTGMNESQLYEEFVGRMGTFEQDERHMATLCKRIADAAESSGGKINYIPAIQPVINDQLTLLTASYGMRIHPFYKTLVSHQGVDYTVPVGSRVFATADGKVTEVATRRTTSGLNIIIDHGNGYETQYSHMSRIDVKQGQTVRRGDIIGLTGNSGLSLSPHLHYEVRYNGMRVDPIHYFFMELSPHDYQRIIKIAQSGMQSFD